MSMMDNPVMDDWYGVPPLKRKSPNWAIEKSIEFGMGVELYLLETFPGWDTYLLFLLNGFEWKVILANLLDFIGDCGHPESAE